MRCFAVPEGRLLVEWAVSPTDVLKADGTPLGEAETFYLLDLRGNVARVFATTSMGIQEHLSTIAYTIEDDALVSYFHDVRWLHEREPTLSRAVELAGLRLIPANEAPSEDDVREAIERHESERRAAAELWRDRGWAWQGKDLYARLLRVAAQKYGDRLTGFEVDVPADEYLRFAND